MNSTEYKMNSLKVTRKGGGGILPFLTPIGCSPFHAPKKGKGYTMSAPQDIQLVTIERVTVVTITETITVELPAGSSMVDLESNPPLHGWTAHETTTGHLLAYPA